MRDEVLMMFVLSACAAAVLSTTSIVILRSLL